VLLRIRAHDIGGHRLRDGGWFRQRLAFRISGSLVESPEFQELDGLGLQMLIDLRGDGEDRAGLANWARSTGVRYRRCPIELGDPAVILAELEAAGPSEADGRQFMERIYRRILDEFGAPIAQAIALIGSGQPVAFGCAAGKDRTGLVAALLQDVLGVHRSAILAGYTSQAPDPVRLRSKISEWGDSTAALLTSPAMTYILGAPAEVMAGAFDYIERCFGSTVAYLESVGLPEQAVRQLRRNLVE
jgi:protein-tyrosine phosphatase